MPDAATLPSILITGPTGNLGREIAARLGDRAAVRGLVRGAPRPVPEVGWVVGDLTQPGTLPSALANMDAVLLIWPFLDTTHAAGVIAELVASTARVVYISSAATDDEAVDQSDPIVGTHAEMETLLRAANLPLTVLRVDTLASNVRGWIGQLRNGDRVVGPDIARTPVVDERDVAEAAAAVLLTPPARATYLLTGPQPLSRADLVRQLGEALGRPLTFEPISTRDARRQMLADGRPEELADALAAASEHRPESLRVSPDLERLTGRAPGTFARWAVDHAAEFR